MSGTEHVSILQALDEPRVWRPWFRDPATWWPWRAFLRALFGLPLDDDAFELFCSCTGRKTALAGGSTEAWLVCGRRAGKSFVLALIACFLATFREWRQYLSPGEVGYIKILAVDRRQARVIQNFCRALLTEVPSLKQMVLEDNDDEIVLNNRVTIEIQTASFRSVRGFTVIAALCDEIAFWRSEHTANPDSEIIAALRPAMLTIPNAFFLAASSPYAKRGEPYNAYRRYWGDDDAPALIWKAPTRVMNPTVPQRDIDEEMERDPASAAAEYLAEFRNDIESFVSREVVEASIVKGRYELWPQPGIQYWGFIDPSGGSGRDSMALAIAHREGSQGLLDEVRVLDAIREWRPEFSPDQVTAEAASTLNHYGISTIRGDKFGGQWVAERFRQYGISYEPTELVKSEIYQEFLPLLNGQGARLLDHERLLMQLCQLESRTVRGSGRPVIDHVTGAHDDLANVAAGALIGAGMTRSQLAWTGML
jgi:hypothetical protein